MQHEIVTMFSVCQSISLIHFTDLYRQYELYKSTKHLLNIKNKAVKKAVVNVMWKAMANTRIIIILAQCIYGRQSLELQKAILACR